MTAYSKEQKIKLLHINKEEAENTNCVSPQIAADMALNVAKMFQTGLGIGTTGYAESNEEIKVPFAYYAISFKGKIINQGEIEDVNISRIEMQKKVSEYVIHKLYEFLQTI
ncbi:CinA family protein [Patescibacteria group bacterium]|nr:CinA family protein [Patescibacteria group bacterium]MBU1757713.1 CinA family protein [Patescibacteria group bacterium]MBU1959589.1 CinA family protein [bacterium]